MRMRKKPNLGPRMERASSVLETAPAELRGRWLERYPGFEKLYVELGCGKGSFTCETAMRMPDTLIVAIERVEDALVMAMEKVCAAQLNNVRFISMDASALGEVFAEGEADRIYINFCNPWPKAKHKKRRLTHTRQLVNYKKFLKGELWFKTDDDELFEESFEYFEEAGFEIKYKTWDLHAESPYENFVTEHEKMFSEEGKKIKFLIAVPKGE